MSKQDETRRRKHARDTLTCKPLDSLEEIRMFLDNPPPWRSLCKELTPHSTFVIRNIEHTESCDPVLELPETYCHFDPDTEAQNRYDVTKKKLPKTLVCHDMANGYHDDSKIEGTQNYAAYTFYNWAAIDIFCYFSHHLITIPPVSWINVGHAHGVKVIGTIITEWADGARFWDGVLSSESEYRDFASAVVAIAKTMKFDGWLLNIENKISKPDVLLEFVRYLHKILHEALDDPVLIWYDSVTVAGNLNWQNGLNDKNKAFFDICDGFFTNYSWTVKNVEDSAKMAGERLTDVFIGIDVWGRNFYGGGQFNVQTAVKVAHAVGCSLAIFAPAWTHEAVNDGETSTHKVDHFNHFEQFKLRDRALWDSLWPFFNTHLPCNLPFQTSFCRGQGKKRWMYGEVISPGPWYNLRHQQYQPNCAHGPHGYVLSFMDKVLKSALSTQAKTGILKYRSELNILRHSDTQNATPSDDLSTADIADDSVEDVRLVKVKPSFIQFQCAVKQESNVATQTIPEGNASLDHVNSSYPKGFKKLISKLKTMFKQTPSEVAQSSEVETSCAARAESPASSGSPGEMFTKTLSSSGRSMLEISVNLNLNTEETKTRWALAHVPVERECLELWLDDGFNGGSCLKLNPSDVICTDHRTIRLFHCDLHCPDTLIICVVTKTLVQSSNQSLNIKLIMKNAGGKDLRVVLSGRTEGVKEASGFDENTEGFAFSQPMHSEQQEAFQKLRQYLLLNEPGFYVPVQNDYGWHVRYHKVHVPGSRVIEVNCRTALPQGGILLGHLGICHQTANT